MTPEIVYLGHDNSIDLVLKADGDIPSLASVTRMTLTFDDLLIDSAVDTGVFDWAQTLMAAEAAGISGAVTGDSKLVLTLGGQTITAGNYEAPLVVYDATYTEGIVWGLIKITVKAEVEAVAAP